MKQQLFLLSFLVLVLSAAAQTPRMVLYEEFTGETCPPCASTNPGLNQLLEADSALTIPIKWQVPIPSAPTKTWSLYQTNKTEIDWRWKSTGYGYTPPIQSAPSSKIDGQEATVFGAASSHPIDLTHNHLVTAQSYTSPFSITIARAWNKSTTAVNVTITVQATAPFSSVGSLVFRTVMVERLIQFSVQPGSNGEKNFEDVAIKSFPTLQLGTSLPGTWTVGQTQTFTLSCPLPAYTRKKDQVAIVGFIQDDGNRKVIQAARANKAAIPQTALSGLSANVDLTCTNLITPTVEIKNESASGAITAMTLTPYVDGIAAPVTQWTGNLAAGATTIITMNQISSPALSGSHTFSCDIDIASPSYNLIKNTTRVTYMSASNYLGTPVAQGFTAAAFPPQGFGVVNLNNGPTWSRSNVSGGYNTSQESTKYDFFNNSVVGDQDEFYLPPMDLSTATSAQLSYDYAYAQRVAESDDALELFVSNNCGVTWTSLMKKHGSSLTTNSNLYANAYVPDSQNPLDHWQTESIDLSGYQQANLLIKFVATSDNGNNLYMDNINLRFADVTGITKNVIVSSNLSLYPNPTNGTTQLKMINMKAGSAKISVVNTLGQVVFAKETTLTEGANTVQLETKELAVGIYNVIIDSQNGSAVKKLNVIK
ncbi:hypothetical protein CNR22_08725 [Sphingobacteriaceae bacterium]|nr:hypothetical protein CNR22_08725 [Sphingobacteriaceae bacterium]